MINLFQCRRARCWSVNRNRESSSFVAPEYSSQDLMISDLTNAIDATSRSLELLQHLLKAFEMEEQTQIDNTTVGRPFSISEPALRESPSLQAILELIKIDSFKQKSQAEKAANLKISLLSPDGPYLVVNNTVGDSPLVHNLPALKYSNTIDMLSLNAIKRYLVFYGHTNLDNMTIERARLLLKDACGMSAF